MVINLDLIREQEDKSGLTSRADGLRNPILEVILEELTYNTIYFSPFLLEISGLSILTTSSSRMCNPGIRGVRACKYCSLVSSCSPGEVMAALVARGARSSGGHKRTSDSGSLLSCSF